MKTWSDPFMRVEIDPARRYVRQTRSAQRYDKLDDLERSLDAIVAHMREVPREQYVLLQDLRAPQGRNDPNFEAVMAQGRPRISNGFRKIAMLVTTQVGRLQIQRYIDADSLNGKVFLDEQEALRWLLANES